MKSVHHSLWLITLLALTAVSAETGVIAGDAVNLRRRPSINGAIVRTLDIGASITVLERSQPKAVINGIEGQWVKVRVDNCTECPADIGWVFDAFIATRERMVPLTSFHAQKFAGCAGDSCLQIDFRSDGSYAYTYPLCHDGNCGPDRSRNKCHDKRESRKDEPGIISCSGRGHVHEYRSVMQLFHFGDTPTHYLMIRRGTICIMPYSGYTEACK